MRFSIRFRLLFILLALTLAVWLATAWGSYLSIRHEVRELFDAQLAQSARSMLSLSSHELQELADYPTATDHIHFIPEEARQTIDHRYEQQIAYQIWLPSAGKLILRTDNAPLTPLSDAATGFSDRAIDDEAWRIFTLDDPYSGYQIQMAQSYLLRDRTIHSIAMRQLLPILLALPLLAILISFGIHRALAPLRALTQAVEARAPDSLEAVPGENIPDEIRPLVAALNRLFARLETALENERRFTADAAHELRTPLAALKVQAQVAMRSSDDEQRRTALGNVLLGVDRATRLVEQLLTLARLDPEHRLAERERLDLLQLAGEVISEQESRAQAEQITLSLAGTQPLYLEGQRESLRILLNNLLDNALRYTPAAGTVRLTVEMQEEHPAFQIDDSGPGVAEDEQSLLFNRFYRGREVTANGSGLGLSIVKRIADLHGASLQLARSDLGGLRVTCLFAPSRGNG